jgi:folate-binding protein YgfZ
MTGPSTSERLAEDYRALRDAAAVVDLGPWTVLELLGNETRAFLQGTATQEFDPAPPPARATRTLFLTEKGRPVAHAWVAFGADPETAWLLSDEGTREILRPHLERFRVMEDVEFRGPDEMPRPLGVAGPERDPLAGAIASRIPGAVAIQGEPLSFVLTPPDADPVALPPFVDGSAFEAWRIQEGIPYQGIDFDTERIATELSVPDVISMTKGCYVGQEVVARTSHRGKLRRQRVGFRFAWGGAILPRETELRSGGMECGIVTSTAWLPGTREGVGMGYVTPETLTTNLDILAVQGEKTTLLRLHSWPL